MKVAIVHPHFRRGGVTRVVENAVAALAPHAVEIACLSGEPYAGTALPRHTEVPGLGYINEFSPTAPAALAADLRAAARTALGGEPDIWHIHNHSLGKNVHLPGALRLLAEEGARLLLQLHDFAEDGRPENYRRLQAAYPERRTFAHSLYPASPAVHYAVLNGRDEAALRTAGVPEGRRHLLPNPVAVPALTDDAPPPELPPGTERLILYPTRAIRRKNLGELLLHAALSPAGTLFATTLRPENPEWRAIHGRWEALAAAKLKELDGQLERITGMKRALDVALACGCVRVEDCARAIAAPRAVTVPAR